jgi:hypothetical protein
MNNEEEWPAEEECEPDEPEQQLEVPAGEKLTLREKYKSYGDWFLKEGRPITFKHRHLAMLKAAGWPNKDIAKKLDLTPSRVSILLSNTMIKDEVHKQQDRMFAQSVEDSMKALGPIAMDQIESILTADASDRSVTTSHRADAAKWLLEKLTGKAKQEVEVQGNLMGNFIQQLEAMTRRGTQISQQGDIMDVTPDASGASGESDKWDDWIGGNMELPEARGDLKKGMEKPDGETEE